MPGGPWRGMKPMGGASASSPATAEMATTDSSVEQGLEAGCSRSDTARQVLWQRRSRTTVEPRAKLERPRQGRPGPERPNGDDVEVRLVRTRAPTPSPLAHRGAFGRGGTRDRQVCGCSGTRQRQGGNGRSDAGTAAGEGNPLKGDQRVAGKTARVPGGLFGGTWGCAGRKRGEPQGRKRGATDPQALVRRKPSRW